MHQIISVLLFLNSCGVRAGSNPAHYMCSCCSSQVRVNWKSVSWAKVCERVLAGVFCQAKIQVFLFRGKDAMGGNATFGKHKKRFWSLFLARNAEAVATRSVSGMLWVVCALGPGSYNVPEHNPCGHQCPYAAGAPYQSQLWAPQEVMECGRAWEESRGLSAGEVVSGVNSGKYLSICLAQHMSRSSEVNWTCLK